MSDDIKDQLAKVTEKLRSVGANILNAVEKAVTDGCLVVVRDAKENAPANTGLLRGSITHKVTSDGEKVEGQVGATVAYAPMVEYGTSPHTSYEGHDEFIDSITRWCHLKGITDQKHIDAIIRHIQENGTVARPFLFPAWNANKEKIHAAIARAVKDGAKP